MTPGIAAAIFATVLLTGSDARADCTTSGAAPVVVTCSGTFTTDNTVNTPVSRTQSFNDSVSATVDATGVITGAGLAPTSTAAGSTVSLTNNGSVSGNVNAAVTVGGTDPGTLVYLGSGSITGLGTAGALQLAGAGAGSSTITISGTSTLTTAVSGGLFVAPGIEIGGTSGTVNVTVLSGGTVQGSNAVQFDGTGSNTLTNSGSVGSVAAGTLTTNGVSASTSSNNSITVINHATGTIAGSITGVLAGASGSVAITNDTGGHITATNTTSAAGVTASVGISAGSVTGSNAGTISGSTHGIDTSGSLPGGSPGTSVNLTSNSGTIQGTATVASGFTVGSGILAETSATVGTNSGTISGGLNGITALTGFVTINSNSGTISGLSGAAISAATTATVTNATGGQITGVTAGIRAVNVSATNSGTISATNGSGVIATTGTLSVTNNAAATISGGSSGIVSGGTSATVHNSGLVTGGSSGISLQGGTSDITNNSGATISGTGLIGSGIQSSTGIAVNLANAGTVSGTSSGIFSGGDATVTSNTGSITGVNDGILASGSANVTNDSGGQITATGVSGVAISASTSITVANAGTISGGSNGALNSSGAVTVTSNLGTISSTNPGLATITGNSVNVTNGLGGSITATGASSIAILSGSLNITNNAGATISGGLDGINQQAGGTATIANTGTISGAGRSALRLGNNASVTNTGTGLITGLIGIVFRDPTATNTPVVNGSVFNSGTITGTGGTAINFAATAGSGPFTLTLGPGSIINGNVLGTGGDLFQLGGATGSDTFNVSNLGAAQQYRGFTTFNKIDGSTWSLTGTGTQTWNVLGGVLAGTATIGGLNVQSGGSFMPGSGAAGSSMAISGNLAFQSGAQYLVQLNPATASFANVSGTATLGGATVNAIFANGSYIAKTYTILTAAGGVSGTFGALVNTNVPATFTPTLSYDANDVFLNLAISFTTPGGLNGNQQNVANALTNFFNTNGGIPMAFATLTPAGLTQASGELGTGSQQTTFDAMSLFMGLLTDPSIAGRGDPVTASSGPPQFAEQDDGASAYAAKDKPRSQGERDAYAAIYRKAPVAAAPFAQRWSVWAAGFGGSQTTDGNAVLGSNTVTSRIAGAAVGADYRFSPFTLAGFALAGGGTNFSLANGLGTGRSDLFQAGAYLHHTVGPAYLSAALAYGWQDITTDRTVTIAGADHLRAEFNANAFSGRLEGGYRFATPWMGIAPYAAAQFTTFDLPAYAEQALSGANTFALAYGSKNVTDTRSELGVRTDRSYAMQDSLLILRGRLAWAHDFNPVRGIAATFQTLPGASFVVNGATPAHDSALTTASAEIKWLNGWSVAATFEGEFSDVTRSYAGKGILHYEW